MNKLNVTKRIDKMKEVMLNLHRSASQLDQMIQSIENELVLTDGYDKDFLMTFVQSQKQYRESLKEAHGYDILNEKEEFYWEKLIDEIKKD